ncbi:Rne/Rng family ribonuclease [Brachybacterium sp. YJGR34]|uniref:Rne/Rng family ribonuclease n=1 Tax=Brachybacterium sp. YJGR34 TaxID=2059911 RepID=UPI000E0BF689|nr:Rne/Rng family ribonuclease [Brachybacterium sp. YJGR34]
MADSTRIPENSENPDGTPEAAPARRQRRRAGSPAGAPAFTPPPIAPQSETAPRTVVAPQEASTEEPAAPAPTAAKRRRRRAGAPAGAPVIPAPAEPEAEESRSEDAEPVSTPERAASPAPTTTGAQAPQDEATAATDDVEPAEDAEEDSSTASTEGADETGENPVVGDLRALATARGEASEPAEDASAEDTDRARRREQVQMDFASLLFQAPTPQPRTTVGAQDAPVGSAELSFAAVEEEPAEEDGDGAEDAGRDEEQSTRSRRSRSRSRRSAQRESGAVEESTPADAPAATESPETSEEDEDRDEESSSESSGGGSRRRRRRGGRGRRGRGRGDDEGDSAEDEKDTAKDTDGSTDSEGDSSSGEGDEDRSSDRGSSSSRRRRRRRRSGGSGSDDSSGSTDDPPNTVVKVREARDEVKAVKGSTRLEAKRQRRREGRDAGRRRNVITEAEFLARRESVKRSMVVRERPGRTQIAVLEDDVLVEHYVAQKSQTSMVGNVYLGKVQNVLPSMEAAFVDIGKGRNAVLYAGEVNWDAVGLEGQPRRIELALKSGDPVLVQVTKDPIGHKGARLTSQISLPGRYVVFVPGGSMTGISRKLPDTERSRLKKIMRQIIPEDAGVIVRTAAEGASEEELTHDVERLRSQWERIQKAQKAKSAPVALSQEPDIAIKVVRDVFNEDFTSLIVEGGAVYDDVHAYVKEVAPDLLERVTKHVGDKDVFAKHRIEEQLLKAMDRKVYLPSGGSLVIDRTEAMTVVDVNTGKFTGSGGSLEETVTKNNLEAAEEIVRQLRLRDIGGIIVIDFIDMVLESNRDLVLRRVVECLGRDRTKHQVAEVTSLGLVQMTRKRVGQGLVETFSAPCEHCHGRGLVVDMDGEHTHGGGGNGGGDESSKSSRRRGRRSRGGAKEAPETEDSSSQESQDDVHRLEDDADSRALARATIASIAAASGSHTPSETSPEADDGAAEADREPSASPAEQQESPAADAPEAEGTAPAQDGGSSASEWEQDAPSQR